MGKVGIKVNCIVNWNGDYARILVMQTLDNRSFFPIIIADNEAVSLLKELEKIEIKRPQTHDLFIATLRSFRIQIREVYIHTVMEGIFYTKLICENDTEQIEIDARPSDAIILALKMKAPIFVEKTILEKLGKESDEIEKHLLSNKETATERPETEESLKRRSTRELEDKLKQAIEIEDFEMASKIRDIINERGHNS